MLDHLADIACFVSRIETGTFDSGVWMDSKENADGFMTMPYFHMGQGLLEFIDAAGPLMVKGFDWSAWIHSDGARVRDEIETATVDELRQLIHALVRQERFVEGLLESAYRDGTLLRIAKRARQLVVQMSADDAPSPPQQG